MIETTQRGDPAPWPEPVAHARPGLSTACSLLAILSAVPLALVAMADRLSPLLPRVVADLGLGLPAEADQLSRILLLAGAAAALTAPVAAWLARVLPPWTVLLAGMLVTTLGYWRGEHAGSLGDITLARVLHGVGAGCLLAATAALVGAATARTRPLLAGGWAAAVVGTAALGPWLVRTGLGPAADWHDRLRPYPWLLAVAAACGLALAAASVADHRPRLFPRWIDLAAFLPLVAAVPSALVALVEPGLPPSAAVLTVVILLGAMLGIAAVALLRSRLGNRFGATAAGAADATAADAAGATAAAANPGRGAVGAGTAAVAFVVAAAVGPTLAGWIIIRGYALAQGSVVFPRGSGGLLVTAAVVGVLAAATGAWLPDARRRSVIIAGLLAAAAGALALLPAGSGVAAAIPGVVLLTGGCGLALGAQLRWVGPLATVVAGAMVAVALPLGEVARGALQSWRTRGTLEAAGPDALTGHLADLQHAIASAQRLWLLVVAVLLLGAAAIVVLALGITRSRSDAHSG